MRYNILNLGLNLLSFLGIMYLAETIPFVHSMWALPVILILTVLLSLYSLSKGESEALNKTAVLFSVLGFCVLLVINTICLIIGICTLRDLSKQYQEVNASIVQVNTQNSTDYLVVEYVDDLDTIQRATVNIYGSCIYTEDDIVSICYDKENKTYALSPLISYDTPLFSLATRKVNPPIVEMMIQGD